MLLSNRDKDNSSEGLKCWPFMSVHQWAENPAGEWQVIIQDNVSDLSRDIPILSSFNILKLYLPPTTKSGQGYIFTGVCDSVHGGGVLSQHALQVVSQHALHGSVCSWGVVCSWGGCLVTPPDVYCCGRYASYWNAFLFVIIFISPFLL